LGETGVRLKEIFILLACLVGFGFASRAQAQLLQKAVVHGVMVQVTGESPNGILVTVGDRVVIRDNDNTTVYIKGVYEGSGKTYVLIAEASGGNACPELYQAIDMSASEAKVSKPFGTCSDFGRPAVINGALTLDLPLLDGKGRVLFTYLGGVLNETKQRVSLEPAGPAGAPGGDLAAFALSRNIGDLFKLRASAGPLMRIMPASDFAEARDMALSGPSSGAKLNGDVVVIGACQAHNCLDHQVTLVFDHFGNAWASILREARLSFFGNPDPRVRRLLDPRIS
jgi:hypothetical protein